VDRRRTRVPETINNSGLAAARLRDFMHATLVARPFHTKGWVYEEKMPEEAGAGTQSKHTARTAGELLPKGGHVS
jgi:hypothetical protein